MKNLNCLLVLFISANLFSMNAPFEIGEELSDRSYQIRATEALYIYLNLVEEVGTRAEIIDRALKIPFEEQQKILPIFIEYSQKYHGFAPGQIDLIRSRESLMGAGASLEFVKGCLAFGMELVIEELYLKSHGWKEKYHAIIKLIKDIILGRSTAGKKFDNSVAVSKKNLRQIARQNVGNGIDLFAREGHAIDNWVDTLFVDAIKEYDSLASYEEQFLKVERQRKKKKTARAQRKKAHKSRGAVSPNVASDITPLKPEIRPDEAVETPVTNVIPVSPVIEAAEKAERVSQEIEALSEATIEPQEIDALSEAIIEPQEIDTQIPLDYMALSFAKKQLGANLRTLQVLAKRELSYEEILALAQMRDFENQKNYVGRLCVIEPEAPPISIKLIAKYHAILTDLFLDREVAQQDFENLMVNGLGGNIVGTRGGKMRITLYQRFQDGKLTGFVRHQDAPRFRGINKNDVVKKISFSVEPPHSRGGSKSGHILYPALQEINKRKLECFGIIPAAFTTK